MQMFYQIPVLKNFAKRTRNHLCRSLFLNKVAGLWSAVLLKKRLRQRCFPVNFAKLFKNDFFYRTPPVAHSGENVFTNGNIQTAQFYQWKFSKGSTILSLVELKSLTLLTRAVLNTPLIRNRGSSQLDSL